LALPGRADAQDAAAKFKTNCVMCHAADGSGNTSAGKALGAKDLRSAEVQKKTDAELNLIISKGKGKMPAFGAKLKADEITAMIGYLRQIAKK
jgi:cytochrome c6